MKYGIEVLIESKKLLAELAGQRVGFLGHPGSVDQELNHSIDLLKQKTSINLSCGFGVQHGLKGDKQYNMEETPNEFSEAYQMPIYSLYSEVRRPTPEMLNSFDVLLFDFQDVGCRIYTIVATLIYMLEACAQNKKSLWVLDRPNPVGRVIDGDYLKPQWKSFVGEVECPIQHGLTLGEIALWYTKTQNLNLDLKIVEMEGYQPNQAPGFGWPSTLPWVNPSPQMPSLKTARMYNGTVLLEGTTLSEARGTTVPLEALGAPDLNVEALIDEVYLHYGNWAKYIRMRPYYFVPTFNKYQGELCQGIQFHVDTAAYQHLFFQPYRLMAGVFKALLKTHPGYPLWNQFHYEYEKERSPIHLICGSEYLKNWVDDANSTVQDFNTFMDSEVKKWKQESSEHYLYK